MRKISRYISLILTSMLLTSCAGFNISSFLSNLFGTNEQQNSENNNNIDNHTIINNGQIIENGIIDSFDIRMPGEFESVDQIIMCYPINMPINVYKTIAEDNKILLLVNPDSHGNSRVNQAINEFDEAGVNLDNVSFRQMELDADYYYWARDFSPFFVYKNKSLNIVDFTYNRPQRVEQNQVPYELSQSLYLPYSKMDLVHTGGNLMQDGRGTAFSDDLVVSENDNNEQKVRNLMKEYTGTNNYVITIDPQGDYIAHIDCWAKIVAPDKIIVARVPQSNSRYAYYEQVASELANLKCIYGYNYRIYRVDEPGGSIVAPYTNSLIANKHVYVPLGDNETYNQNALNVYEEALPGYTIHGVYGFNSNQGNEFLNTDALHCRTHEIPSKEYVLIDSREVNHGLVDYQDSYVVKMNLDTNISVNPQPVPEIHYSINNASYSTEFMNNVTGSTNYTYEFDNLNPGDDVKYYITYMTTSDPTCGELDPHHFIVGQNS